jgi:hypothetical protein
MLSLSLWNVEIEENTLRQAFRVLACCRTGGGGRLHSKVDLFLPKMPKENAKKSRIKGDY